jgi:glycosyltransferase involved in cell wall biosynthesis
MNIDVSCLGSIYRGSLASEFRQSINSLLFGGLRPSEIVVVVDGPISSELDYVLCGYVDNGRVNAIRLSSNRGLGPALRVGLEACSHEIVCRFDTDDINLEGRLAALVAQFHSGSQGVDVVSSSILEFEDSSSPVVRCRVKRSLVTHRDLSAGLDFRNTLNHPAVAFRKSSVINVGSYEDVPFFEDYFLWLKLRKAGFCFAGIDQPLVCMRRASSSLRRRSGFRYFLFELGFVARSFKRRLLPLRSLPFMLARALTRLLPSSVQSFQDFLPWRGRPVECCNPAQAVPVSFDALNLRSRVTNSEKG